jgi:hypothetical protein
MSIKVLLSCAFELNIEASQPLLLNFRRKFEVDWTPEGFMRVAANSRWLMAHHRVDAHLALYQFVSN